jgi:2,3-dihydroxybenzoate-AMP ligase
MRAAKQVWPDDFAERYRASGYWRGELLSDMLHRHAAASPERLAVVSPDARWTYAELERRARRIANGLRALGIAPGERVLLHLPNIPEFLAVVFALFDTGIIPVFALPGHRASEITSFANAAEAVAYVIPDVHEGFDYRTLADAARAAVPTLRHVLVVGDPGAHTGLADVERDSPVAEAGGGATRPRSSDVAHMQLSGGSTGLSKLIPRTHDDYLYSVRASAEICRLDERTVFMIVLPVAHNFPMSSPGFLGVLYAGGTVVLSPSPSPDVAFPLIAREGVTWTSLVPPLVHVWLDAAARDRSLLATLEVVQVGGAKLPVEIARRIGPGLGVKLQQVFGMAEGLVNYTRLDDDEETIVTTQGRPISPDDEVRIVDDADNPVPDGEAGNLLTRGPYTIRAYHNADADNARAFTADGFYRTGDIVARNAAGYLVVLGRATDQINRGGEKVSPDEIENHLLAHPSIADAVVVSIPDPYLGERTCAYILPRGDAPRAPALKAWIRGRGLASYKVPDQIVFVDSFPSTNVGKISRKELRAALRAQATQARDTAPRTTPA